MKRPRLAALLAEGVTTIEIKSGYGLTLDDEAKMLRVARELGRAFPVTVRTTLLAAHTLPPESGRADAYIDAWRASGCRRCTRRGWSTRSTCSASASPSASRRPSGCSRRRALGVPVKMHAEQLANLGGRAGGTARRAVLRPPRIRGRGRGRSSRRRRHRRGAVARRLLLPGRGAPAAPRSAALGARCDRDRQRLQARLRAGHLAPAGDEHGDAPLRAHREEALRG